ncbi:hypothetical protein TSACC_2536 [Terrimicrobium sacchariphilum]|uniref:DUF3592 domain-containing protein n=1 Tax=Terrimicrobium sacchariphilum TaxID=690879 RepID=A0A146G2R1_TERSA|nr:DUF3592 domain-containing protein [Terrimicrobium sacchariphilum]GAT32139.1 hypothetical protein TSACC_2536 [Terrimicrobium sacchariphilum]
MSLPAYLAAMPRVWWFSILFGGFFIIWIWLSSGYLRAFRKFRTWPSVPGRLLSAGTEEFRHGWEDDHTVNVRYQYQVGDAVYEGRVIESIHLYVPPSEPVGFHKRQRALRYLAQLHRGGDVTVYYDPDDPTQAFLRHSSQAPLYFGWAVLVTLLALCALAWLS